MPRHLPVWRPALQRWRCVSGKKYVFGASTEATPGFAPGTFSLTRRCSTIELLVTPGRLRNAKCMARIKTLRRGKVKHHASEKKCCYAQFRNCCSTIELPGHMVAEAGFEPTTFCL